MFKIKRFMFLLLFIPSYFYAMPLLQYVPTVMHHTVQTIKPHNLSIFNQFQKKINDLHLATKNMLLNLSNQKITLLDESTKKYLTEQKNSQQIVLNDAQKKLDDHDFLLLQTAVIKQQSLYDDLEKYWSILSDFWEKYALSFLRLQANSTNSYKDKQAVVQEGDELLTEEKSFLTQRSSTIQTGLKKFFKSDVAKPLCLGYAAPGGGYRAMILTSGYVTALEDLGLLDATSYFSAVSGSTWFLMPWIFFKGSVREYQQTLLKKIKDGLFNPALALFSSVDYISPDYLSSIVNVVWPKFLFNQQISSVDVYGSLIAYVLFSKENITKHLTDQWDYVKDGSKPFPIYNASSTINKDSDNPRYYWNEFNPLEVRNNNLNVAIPAYSFGSEFDGGKSKEIAPLQSLSYFLGTFGSAYLVDLIDVKKICVALQNESANKSSELAAEYLMVATIINLINVLPLSISTYRVFPSLINNPYKNALNNGIPSEIKQADALLYLDGGIICNIPARSLMRKSRKVNVIIIGDTSGDNPKLNEVPFELNRLFQQAQTDFGYSYNLVGDATLTIRFYKDSEHTDAPRIIYVNFVKDVDLINKGLKDLELKKIIDRGNLTKFDFSCVSSFPGMYCNFLYFQYTEQEFNQLAAIAEFNIQANKALIEKFLRDELV